MVTVFSLMKSSLVVRAPRCAVNMLEYKKVLKATAEEGNCTNAISMCPLSCVLHHKFDFHLNIFLMAEKRFCLQFMLVGWA